MVADYTLDWEYWRAPDGKYLYVSPACEDITGYSAAEFIENSDLIVKITHPEDKNVIACHLNDLINNDVSDNCVIEFRIITRSGEIKYIEHRCRSVYRSGGTWIGNRGSNKDITERKRFEKALESERDRANAATSAKSLFLAKMSHEIRTPMNSVLGFANLLKMTALNGEQSEYVNVLSDSTEKLLGIINDILDISKIEAGKLTLNRSAFDLRNLVLDCVRSLSFAASSKNIFLKEEFDEKLSGLMIGDETRLRQIIINLMNNAIKFTQAGGVKLKVTLLNETEDCVEAAFAVADTGTGIAPDAISGIFEKYVQADSELHRKNIGTGLGLTIVKNLLDLMGGTISVKSEPGVGSEFLVKIRFLKAAGVKSGTGEAGPKADTGVYGAAHARKPENKKIKLLIAEDEPSSRRLMQKIVEMKGWEASIAPDGNAVIEMAVSGDYDAILMDIQMPGLDGISAAKSIGRTFREAGRKMIPIVALTAGAMPGEIQECAEAGMDCVILKPLNVADFYNKVEKLIESGKK
jgi:PAS domain S-box-containing protein